VVTHDDGAIEVISAPHDFADVKDGLERFGLKAEFADVIMKPLNEMVVTGEDAVRMQKILDALDNVDDMQQVYTNAVIAEG
jgi:transcriptional/translational regulatory protein YebC/TACO1